MNRIRGKIFTPLRFSIIVTLFFGCGPTSHDEREYRELGSNGQSASNVTLTEMNYEQFQQLIASRRGRIVVVDIWATWCPPCVKEFSNLVSLSREYGTDQLACVSLSCDHQGIDEFHEVKQQVLEFLTKHKATIDNVISTLESDVLFKRLGITSVPVIDIYAPSGELFKRFDLSKGEDFTYADVRRVVESLSQSVD